VSKLERLSTFPLTRYSRISNLCQALLTRQRRNSAASQFSSSYKQHHVPARQAAPDCTKTVANWLFLPSREHSHFISRGSSCIHPSQQSQAAAPRSKSPSHLLSPSRRGHLGVCLRSSLIRSDTELDPERPNIYTSTFFYPAQPLSSGRYSSRISLCSTSEHGKHRLRVLSITAAINQSNDDNDPTTTTSTKPSALVWPPCNTKHRLDLSSPVRLW